MACFIEALNGSRAKLSPCPSTADGPMLTVRFALRALYGASRTRTGDLLGAIQALSQLSYSPMRPSTAGRDLQV
jgi:hypothetical protein